MLKRIRLKDFKSFVDEEVELAPLTLLVGANASGKSNFLDALRLLQGLSLDLALAQILEGEDNSRPDAWPGIRGRTSETPRFGIRGTMPTFQTPS
jgi:predicted ATPase